MKRNKCLTGYVILFMIGSFSAGLTLLLTAVVLQQERDNGHASSSSSSSTSSIVRSAAGADPTKHSLRSFATVNVRRQLMNQSLPFVQDVVCGGCRSAVVQLGEDNGERRGRRKESSAAAADVLPTYRCGDVLRLDGGSALSSHTSNRTQQLLVLPEIAMTSRQRQELSKLCRPHCYECPAARKKYWRYDRVLVPNAPIPILQLLSVPPKHRIPDHALRFQEDGTSNLTEYLRPRIHRSLYYFDYNPSIVLLPPGKKSSPSKESKWEDDPFEGAAYAASFRVSTMHSCFRPEVRKYMKRNSDEPADYVGIALLDHRFEIVQDAVYDLKSALNGQGQVQDVRLFVLHDQLYLSSHDWIAPVWIGISGSSADQQPPAGYRPVRRVFGNHEQRNMDFWMRSYVSCAGCLPPSAANAETEANPAAPKSCGKNFNYFALSKDASKALVEVWPSPPHQVRTVDLQSHCQRDVAPERFVDDRSSTPASTFSTVEELHFPGWNAAAQQRRLLTRGRGGACCVGMSVRDPLTGKATPALVGIQHVKTPPQRGPAAESIIENHYLSRFYAFEPTPPYRMISQSGYFCLGFGTDLNALNEATRWRSLMLGERFEKCPRIHFVSGMTLKSQDPSTLVITYGINDCVSAITQVTVKAVQQLLSRGPAMLRQATMDTAQA
jgi:hypothetical protein